MILKQRYKIYRETGETSEKAVEILRVPQNVLVQGRYLEMDDPTGLPPWRKTNNILITRNDLIATTF